MNLNGVEMCRPGLHTAQRLVDGDPPPDPDQWLDPDTEVSAAAHAAPAEPLEEGGGDAEDL